MTLSSILLIAGLRISLFVGCRLTLLPILLGEAQHASLDNTGNPSDGLDAHELPTPATTSQVSRHTRSISDVVSRWQSLALSLKDPHQASSHMFSLCFEESTILFVLVLLEATGRVSTEALKRNWTFSLVTVVFFAVLMIPLCACLLVTFRVEGLSILQRSLFALPIFLGWFALFVSVPLPSVLATSGGYLDASLARTALLGVVLIALLSGSAAASSSWDTYEAFFAKRKPRAVTMTDVKNAESSFQRTCSDLASRRKAIETLRNVRDPETQNASFLGRWWGSSQRSKEIKSLQQEIFGLETLASAMRDDLDALRSRYRHAMWSRTVQGRLLLGAGHLFSIYCVWRVVLAALSLIIIGYKDQAPPDFVSMSLAYLVRLVNVDIDLATWTRIFGLLFVGALIIVRMRTVLANLSSFFRAASAGISTSFLVLFLAEVLTIYLLATLIQLRASLPSAYSGGTLDGNANVSFETTLPSDASVPLLATLPSFNVVFGALFDGVFLLAALVTGGLLWYTGHDDTDRMTW